MARVQVGYDPRAEALQTTAAPNIRAVRASTDVRSSSGFQLAEALGAASVQTGLSNLQKQYDEEEKRKAEAKFNSMTVAQRAEYDAAAGGLKSESKVYQAAFSHLDSNNAAERLALNVESRLNRGETFSTPEKLQEHLTEERNKVLAGKDQFAIAGFDKKWGQMTSRLIDANSKALDGRKIQEGAEVASDATTTVLNEAKRDGLSPQDTVSLLLESYDLSRTTNLLGTPKAQDAALKGIATRLATSGDKETLAVFLDSKLPGNGPSIRAKLGDQDSEILLKSAEGSFDKKAGEAMDDSLLPFRQEAYQGTDPAAYDKKLDEHVKGKEKYIGSALIASLKQQNRAALAAKASVLEKLTKKVVEDNEDAQAVQYMEQRIAEGKPVMDVTTPSGRSLTAQALGEAAMDKIIRANPEMPFAEQVRRYALGGVDNKVWKREFGTALFNIGEVNIDASGKPTGQLMPATTEALDKFAMVRQVSEGYARDIAGGDKNYEMLTHIQALRENGIGDTNLAAALVNQKARRNMSAKVWGNIQNDVTSALESALDPGMFTGRFWGEVFRGEFGDSEKNVLPIKNGLRSLAETYLAAGVAKSGSDAVRMAGEYYANPAVTTQINNTAYLNKDLPELPAGVDRTAWFSKAMDEFVGARISAQGIKYKRSDLTLIPQDGGNSPYMISLRGQPTGQYVTKKEISDWVTVEKDNQDLADSVRLSAPKKNKLEAGPKITFPQTVPSPYQ